MEKNNQQNQEASLTDAYSLFIYAIRTQITRDYYLRRLRSFFDFIELLPNEKIELRCNQFAALAINSNWTFSKIIGFLQFQKERVQREEITAATLYNFVKALKLFCEMSDIPVEWKKITRGLPKVRSFANDRATTVIQKIPNLDARNITRRYQFRYKHSQSVFTKPDSKIPIIKINITTAEVQLEKHTFSISILGTIDETESTNVPFADIDIDQIIKDYKNLNPLIKEGISHSITPGRNPNRIASRSVVVKFRMFDKMYEEDEHYGYDINEGEIARLVLPYLISMHDIYGRIYRKIK